MCGQLECTRMVHAIVHVRRAIEHKAGRPHAVYVHEESDRYDGSLAGKQAAWPFGQVKFCLVN
jgi:hypothetical protein